MVYNGQREGGERVKAQITLDDELMRRIDSYADECYMSRSGFISLACVQYLNQQEAFRLVKEMSVTLKKIAETGNVDEETRRELDDYERLCRMITSVT